MEPSKKLYVRVGMSPAPVRVPSQCPFASSATSVKSANYKGVNEIKPGTVHRSPDIYFRYTVQRPSDEDCARNLCLRWGSPYFQMTSVGSHKASWWEESERRKDRKGW